MKAAVYHGQTDIQVDTVPDPKIEDNRDIIVKITSTAICGSDLHLYDGYVPTVEKGDILGHEFMGEVVETGRNIKDLKIGDKVVVPFTISCGECYFCRHALYSLCDNSNPNKSMADKMYGYSPAGIYGYSHMFGGYPGGQAEYARVPYADVGPIKVDPAIPDEKVLFLSDIFPTGYEAAERCGIQPGQTIAVWGCGPVGLFSIISALMFGAEKVIAIDRFPERLSMAEKAGEGRVVTINYEETDNVINAIKDITDGRGPDACIDAVGMEAHGAGIAGFYDKVKQAVRLESDRPTALREAVQACRKGGTLSIIGVYGGIIDKFPIGAAFNKGLTIKQGQCNVQHYMRILLSKIMRDEIDPSFLITHRLPLDQIAHGYDIFKKKEDHCVKVVLKP